MRECLLVLDLVMVGTDPGWSTVSGCGKEKAGLEDDTKGQP